MLGTSPSFTGLKVLGILSSICGVLFLPLTIDASSHPTTMAFVGLALFFGGIALYVFAKLQGRR